jgi:hypothetical protein
VSGRAPPRRRDRTDNARSGGEAARRRHRSRSAPSPVSDSSPFRSSRRSPSLARSARREWCALVVAGPEEADGWVAYRGCGLPSGKPPSAPEPFVSLVSHWSRGVGYLGAARVFGAAFRSRRSGSTSQTVPRRRPTPTRDLALLSINVMYAVDDPEKRAVGFKLSEGMEVPAELASSSSSRAGSRSSPEPFAAPLRLQERVLIPGRRHDRRPFDCGRMPKPATLGSEELPGYGLRPDDSLTPKQPLSTRSVRASA